MRPRRSSPSSSGEDQGLELTPITRAQLKAADGRDGRPALFAYAGLVYDASTSWHWRGGRHQVLHPAGADLTDELGAAPHGADLLERLPLAGRLVGPKEPG